MKNNSWPAKRRSPRLASNRARPTSTEPTDMELEFSCPTNSDNSTILERNHSLNVNAVSNSNNSTILKRSHSLNVPNAVSNNNSTISMYLLGLGLLLLGVIRLKKPSIQNQLIQLLIRK